MAEIILARGEVALIDDADLERVSAKKWYRLSCGYAAHSIYMGNKKYRALLMHRFILDAPPGSIVDHKNGNRLDNRRENLRFCTHQQNMVNSVLVAPGRTSKYRGVSWDAERGKWRAHIKSGSFRTRFLGRFRSEEEAARAYDRAAVEQHGEFARPNNPEMQSAARSNGRRPGLLPPDRDG